MQMLVWRFFVRVVAHCWTILAPQNVKYINDVALNLHDRNPNDRSICWKGIWKWFLANFLGGRSRTAAQLLAPQKVSYRSCIIKFAWSRSRRPVELLKKQVQCYLAIFFAERSRPVAGLGSHCRTVLAPQNVSYKWRCVKFARSRSKRSGDLLKRHIKMAFWRIFWAARRARSHSF